jgi:hypothetical protein
MTENEKRIQHDCMTLFEQSVGYEFRVKATPLTDIVDGVDWRNMTVRGRKYGDFGVHLCELTGPVKQNEQP